MTRGRAPATSPQELDWQRVVVELARRLRWDYYHTHRSDRSPPGFPDLVLWRDRVIFAELKAEGGKLSPAQRHVIQGLRLAGAEAYVWHPRDLESAKIALEARRCARCGTPAFRDRPHAYVGLGACEVPTVTVPTGGRT